MAFDLHPSVAARPVVRGFLSMQDAINAAIAEARETGGNSTIVQQAAGGAYGVNAAYCSPSRWNDGRGPLYLRVAYGYQWAPVDGHGGRFVERWYPLGPTDEERRAFGILLSISADSPAELRACDVYRVVSEAADIGLAGFAEWLEAERPDLAKVIREALADLTTA